MFGRWCRIRTCEIPSGLKLPKLVLWPDWANHRYSYSPFALCRVDSMRPLRRVMSVLLYRFLVIAILTNMVTITMKTLVVWKPHSMFLCHGSCRFFCGGFRIVFYFRFSRTLTYVRIDVEQSPCVSRNEKVSEESGKRKLILDHKDNVSKFHLVDSADLNCTSRLFTRRSHLRASTYGGPTCYPGYTKSPFVSFLKSKYPSCI